jgi:predicted acylesterase/phospholipase RssA
MDEKENDENPTIKHIVISGGGTYGLAAYGVLKETNMCGLWDVKNIENCFCTSIGAFISVIILLGYDWETLDTFFIKRPWNEVFKYDIYTILNSYDNCGIFEASIIENGLKPLFNGADISINITLHDFFVKTGVKMHIYTVELNTFKLICLSHTTHPNWRLIDALYATSCLPFFLKPLYIENSIFIDGGIFLNYPLLECLKLENINSREILGICRTNSDDPNYKLKQDSNLIEYVIFVFFKILSTIKQDCYKKIENEIFVYMNPITASSFYEFANSETYRVELIKIGMDAAKSFIKKGEC